MRNLLALIFTSLLFAACSGSSALQQGQLSQGACFNQTTVNDQREFIGETVENLSVYQNGSTVYASMDVRTHCNAQLAFSTETPKGKLIFKLWKNN